MKSCREFFEAEESLNTSWSLIKQTLRNSDEFKQILQEQRDWLNNFRVKKALQLTSQNDMNYCQVMVQITRERDHSFQHILSETEDYTEKSSSQNKTKPDQQLQSNSMQEPILSKSSPYISILENSPLVAKYKENNALFQYVDSMWLTMKNHNMGLIATLQDHELRKITWTTVQKK